MLSFGIKKRSLRALHDIFGIDQFRPGQEKAVQTLLSGRDLLCIFPTGAGKSLCFQLPAVMSPRPTVVVSPLIALMRDQVQGLRRRHIDAVCLDSQQSPAEFQASLAMVRSGQARLIYVSTERLKSRVFIEACMQCPPWLVVVDEAHCIVQWGADFRPAYREIAAFVTALPIRPVLCAMTATADRAMQREIAASLGLRFPKIVGLPLIRENLRFDVVTTIARDKVIRSACQNAGKSLVFCSTRREAEITAEFLRRFGLRAAHYHAGLPKEERRYIETLYASGEITVLASTSAFGMGVDIPDIRLVVHRTLPENMIDLIQQAGRAGRDGRPARVLILLDPLDVEYKRQSLVRRQVESRSDRAALSQLREDQASVRQVLDWCLNGRCLTQGMARVFGQRVGACGQCSACERAARAGRTDRLAPMPDLRSRGEGVIAWTLRWQRDSLVKASKLPRMGFHNGMIHDSITRGVIRCGKAWQGQPQERLQALLDHMNHANHT